MASFWVSRREICDPAMLWGVSVAIGCIDFTQVWDLMEGDYTVISDIPTWAGVDVATLPPQVEKNMLKQIC